MNEQTTIRAAVAISPSAAVVYMEGVNCRTCDTAIDPYNRTGVPCRDPHGHANVTVLNWRENGSSAPEDYHVVNLAIVDRGDTSDNITAAREAAL